MIAAVESILSQTEATEETKSLIRQQVSSLLMAHRPRDVLSKVERDALRELKADKDLVIVPADMGRSTVVLDRKDYLQKAKGLLEDRQFYVPCATNPVKALTREINATLLAFENSGAITPTDRRMARSQDTALARFYGLPKVHKDGAPLRPIVSLKGTPAYGLAKWLFRRLKFLTAESDTTVSSSAQFLEKLKGDLAIETIELLLQSKYDETENRLGRAQVLQLLKFCLRTYFTFDGTIYEQVKGTPMGSPISGFIAEAVLQRLESLVFQHHKPKFWARGGTLVHNLSSKELTKEQVQVLRHDASFNTAEAKPVKMIAAVESAVISQTEAAEETKNLIRHQVSFLLMTQKPREIVPNVERDAPRELKADRDIVIVPADKGRSTVVLDRTDYLQKANNLLEDRQFYVPCEGNPVETLTREINATLLGLETSGAIRLTDRRMAGAQEKVNIGMGLH
ncbi:hypothetical protein SprV_0702388200 [Sparganum proliferum]